MAVLTAMCNVAIAVRLTATVFGWRTGVDDKGIEPAIRLAYRKIVNRPPSEKELAGITESMQELERQFVAAKETGQRNKALAAVCHALFNSAAFLYVD